MIACQGGHIQIVKALIEAQADVNYAQPAYMANPKGEGTTALICASIEGHAEIVEVLVSAGANVNHIKKDVFSALIWASQEGHIQTVQALIEAQADLNYAMPANILEPQTEGATALIYASEYGHTKVVKALLDANADVFHTAANGFTALSIAIHFKHPAIVDMLKAHIAQKDTKLDGSSK